MPPRTDAIDAYQALEFLNIDGAKIVFEETSLAGSVQDNGFSVQSEKFDYLLDLDGNIIQVADGEALRAALLSARWPRRVGDMVAVASKNFPVAGFHRDSQMNSLLASSKRFLVSEKDYAEIRQYGSLEYLIEFRLKDPDPSWALSKPPTPLQAWLPTGRRSLIPCSK